VVSGLSDYQVGATSSGQTTASTAGGGGTGGQTASGGQGGGDGGSTASGGSGGEGPAPGSVLWTAQVESNSSAWVTHVRVVDSGVVIAGICDGTVKLGDYELGGPSKDPDLFVAKLNNDGVFQWAARLGGSDTDAINALVIGEAGNIYLAGTFKGTFGASEDPSLVALGSDIFVVKLDANGHHIWSRQFGGTGDDEGWGLAYHSNKLALTGGYSESIKIGMTEHKTVGDEDIFVALLDTAGQPTISWTFGGEKADSGSRIRFYGNGDMLVGAHYTKGFVLGPAALPSTNTLDMAVFRMKQNGEIPWAVGYGGNFIDMAAGLDLFSTEEVAMVGGFTSKIKIADDLDAGPLLDFDAFVAVLGVNGVAQWSKRIGGDDIKVSAVFDMLSDVAINANDDLVAVGRCALKLDLTLELIDCTDGDPFFVMYSKSGELLWSLRPHGSSLQIASTVDIDAKSNLLIGGAMSDQLMFGADHTLTAKGNTDGFIVKIAAP